jgi:hypothetical protein
MATINNTNDGIFNLPYPLSTDPVDVHGDIESLVERLLVVLPPLGLSQFQIAVRNNTASSLVAGTPVIGTGSITVNGNPKVYVEIATTDTESPILGLIKTDIDAGEDGIAVVAGVMENINLSDGTFENGSAIYVSSSGWITGTRPVTGNAIAVGVVAHSGSNGVIVVQAKGNGTWGALKDGLS